MIAVNSGPLLPHITMPAVCSMKRLRQMTLGLSTSTAKPPQPPPWPIKVSIDAHRATPRSLYRHRTITAEPIHALAATPYSHAQTLIHSHPSPVDALADHHRLPSPCFVEPQPDATQTDLDHQVFDEMPLPKPVSRPAATNTVHQKAHHLFTLILHGIVCFQDSLLILTLVTTATHRKPVRSPPQSAPIPSCMHSLQPPSQRRIPTTHSPQAPARTPQPNFTTLTITNLASQPLSTPYPLPAMIVALPRSTSVANLRRMHIDDCQMHRRRSMECLYPLDLSQAPPSASLDSAPRPCSPSARTLSNCSVHRSNTAEPPLQLQRPWQRHCRTLSNYS